MGYGREKSNVETRRMQEFEAEIRWIEDRLEDIDQGQVLPEEVHGVLTQLSEDLNILERRLTRPMNAYEEDMVEHVATLVLNVNKRRANNPMQYRNKSASLNDLAVSSREVFASAEAELANLSNTRNREIYTSNQQAEVDPYAQERRNTSERRGQFTGHYIGSERREKSERRLETKETENRLNTIEKHMARLSENVEASPRMDNSSDIHALRRDIAALGTSLSSLAPKRSLESLEAAIRSMSDRLESSKEIDLDKAVLAMGRLVHEMKSAVDFIRPEALLEGVENEVRTLSRKFEVVSSKGIDPTAFARLQHQLSEMRDQIEKAIQPQTFDRFSSLVDSLADKLSSIDSPAAYLETLQRIEEASTHITKLAEQSNTSSIKDELESAITPLIARMEAVLSQPMETEQELPEQLVSELQSIQNGIKALSPEHYLGAIAERFNAIDDAISSISGMDYVSGGQHNEVLQYKLQESILELKSSLQNVLNDIGTVLHDQTQAIIAASETDEDFAQELATTISNAVLEKQSATQISSEMLNDIHSDIVSRFAQLSNQSVITKDEVGERIETEFSKGLQNFGQQQEGLISKISSVFETTAKQTTAVIENQTQAINQTLNQTLNQHQEQLINALQSKLSSVQAQYSENPQAVSTDVQEQLQSLSKQISSLQTSLKTQNQQDNSQEGILNAIQQRYDALSDEISLLSANILDQKKASKNEKSSDAIYAKLETITDGLAHIGNTLASEKVVKTDQDLLKNLNKRFDSLASDIQTLTTALGSKDNSKDGKKGASINANAVNNAKLAKSVETLSEELSHLGNAVEALINGAQELASDSESNKQAFQSLEKTLQFIDKKLENQFNVSSLLTEMEELKAALPETLNKALKAADKGQKGGVAQVDMTSITNELKAQQDSTLAAIQDLFEEFIQVQSTQKSSNTPAAASSDIEKAVSELHNKLTSLTMHNEVQDKNWQTVLKAIENIAQKIDSSPLSENKKLSQLIELDQIKDLVQNNNNDQSLVESLHLVQTLSEKLGQFEDQTSIFAEFQNNLSSLMMHSQTQDKNWQTVLKAIENIAQKIDSSSLSESKKLSQMVELDQIKQLVQNGNTDQSLVESLRLVQTLSAKLDQLSDQTYAVENVKAVENLEKQVGRLTSQIDQSWSKINNIAIIEKLLESLHGQVSALRSESTQVANISAQLIAREGANLSSDTLEKILKTNIQNVQDTQGSKDLHRIEHNLTVLIERQEKSEALIEKALRTLQSFSQNTPVNFQKDITSEFQSQNVQMTDVIAAQNTQQEMVSYEEFLSKSEHVQSPTVQLASTPSETIAEIAQEQVPYVEQLAKITSMPVQMEDEQDVAPQQQIAKPAQELEGLEWLKAYEQQNISQSSGTFDELIEPGSTSPIIKSQHEKSVHPYEFSEDAAKTSYLQTARKAAQDALNSGEQSINAARLKPASSVKGSLDKLSGFLSSKKRPLAMAAAVALVAVGTLQVMRAINDQTLVIAQKPSEPLEQRVLTAQKPSSTEGTLKSSQDFAEVDKSRIQKDSSERILPRIEQAEVQTQTPQLGNTIVQKSDDDANTNITTASIPQDVPTPRPSATLVPSSAALPEAIAPKALRAAAESGDPISAYDIGSRYAEGRGVTRDFTEAAKWFEKAAAHGLAPAQYRLAMQYEKGLGISRDPRLAEVWYKKAAERGNIKAMHNLAVMYSEGALGQVDYDKALAWFREAASFGVHDSIYNLGILSARGLGVARNLEDAYIWFSIAAIKGDKDAASKRDEIAAILKPEQLAQLKERAGTFKARLAEKNANEVQQPLAMKQK